MGSQRQSSAVEPGYHLFARQAEAAMGVLIAQFLEIMGCEIDDEQASVRFQDAPCLEQSLRRLI